MLLGVHEFGLLSSFESSDTHKSCELMQGLRRLTDSFSTVETDGSFPEKR